MGSTHHESASRFLAKTLPAWQLEICQASEILGCVTLMAAAVPLTKGLASQRIEVLKLGSLTNVPCGPCARIFFSS
jgi:hypothetical protein